MQGLDLKEPDTWKGYPIQSTIIKSDVFEIFYYGARGAGKTETAVMKPLYNIAKGCGLGYNCAFVALEKSGYEGMHAKAVEYAEKFFPGSCKITKRQIDFDNGAKMIFSHCKNNSDYMKIFHGKEYCYIAFDELTIWPSSKPYVDCLNVLRTTKTREDGTPLPLNMLSTANPPTTGSAAWVKDRFLTGKTLGKVYYRNNNKSLSMVSYKSLTKENKALLQKSSSYVSLLESIEDPIERAAYLHGEWPTLSSSPFDSVWCHENVVVEPFEIPMGWRIDISMDWGTAKPFSIGWWAESDGSPYLNKEGQFISTCRGDLFRIHEYYGSVGKNIGEGLTGREVASKFRSMDNWNVNSGVIDSGQYRSDYLDLVVHPFKKVGVNLRPSKKFGKDGREASLKRLRTLISNAKTGDHPQLRVFNTCKHFIHQIPRMRYQTNPDGTVRTEDVCTKQEDHIYDETRYRINELNLLQTAYGFDLDY